MMIASTGWSWLATGISSGGVTICSLSAMATTDHDEQKSVYQPHKDYNGENKKREMFNLPRNGLWLARGEPAISFV